MSTWTHVAGIVRYDSLLADRKSVLHTIRYIEDMFHDAPSGSEGGLAFDVIPMFEHDQKSQGVIVHGPYLANAIISGDLRDFGPDDWPQLEAWFDKVSDADEPDLNIRQAILLIESGDNLKVLKKVGRQ